MKYSADIEINKGRDRVVELFDDPKNLNKWMEGLESFDHIEGEQGQPGSKHRMKFKMGKREIEMVETIKERNLPESFTATYEANNVFNIVTVRFEEISENKTKYITDQEFQFEGFMKYFAWFMPGAFKKQSMKILTNFKNFVESEP